MFHKSGQLNSLSFDNYRNFQVMQVTLTENQNVPYPGRVKWNSIDINNGNLFDNSSNSINPNPSRIYFSTLAFKGDHCKMTQFNLQMSIETDYRVNIIATRSGIIKNAHNGHIESKQTPRCTLESTKDGKESLWHMYSIDYGNHFFAICTKMNSDHFPNFEFNLLDPKRGFVANFRKNIIRVVNEGIYYINFSLKQRNKKFELCLSINKQEIEYTRIISKTDSKRFIITTTLGTILHLQKADELALHVPSHIETYSSLSGKNSYILGFELNRTAPYFLAYGSLDSCNRNGVFEKLQFDFVKFDNMNSWDFHKRSYRITRPGIYQFDINIPVNSEETFMTVHLLINDKIWMSLKKTKFFYPMDSGMYRSGLIKVRAFDEISIIFNGCLESQNQETIFSIFYLPDQTISYS